MSSDRQWRDVVGLLLVQDVALDRAYLEEIAVEVGLEDLLSQALAEAELDQP
jgi:hypothetical protein